MEVDKKYLLHNIPMEGATTSVYGGYHEVKVLKVIDEHIKLKFISSGNSKLLKERKRWFNKSMIENSMEIELK